MTSLGFILGSAVRVYRWVISPAKVFLFGPTARCRFTPTCSSYALEAIETHGAMRGGWMAVKRIGRCHPWGGCGHDPVPPLSVTLPTSADAPQLSESWIRRPVRNSHG